MQKKAITNEIGRRVYDLRMDRGYSRERFAEICSISSKFVYDIEVNGVAFSIRVLEKLARGLEVSADYILFGEVPTVYGELAEMVEKFKPDSIRKIGKLLEIVYNMVNEQ